MVMGLFLTTPALADPELPVDISWQAPAGCPQERDVRDRIRKILGSKRPYSHLRAEGTIARTNGRFRLELVVRAGDLVGTRRIESSSCEDLTGAAAVELGLLIHSSDLVAEPSGSQIQPPTSPPDSSPGASGSRSDETDRHLTQDAGGARPVEKMPISTKEERPPETASESKEQPSKVASQRTWRALVQPLGALSIGPLPKTAFGLGLSLGFEHARWQWQLRTISWQRQSIPAPDRPMVAADVDRIAVDFWACREFRTALLGVSPCLTVGLERVSARGTGQDITPSTQHATGMTAGAGIQGRLYLANWLRLLMSVGGQIELSQPQISIGGVGSVYQSAPAALSIAIGLEGGL
jgi:hypothetical protein